MRYLKSLCVFLLLLSGKASAQWIKISDVDYVWGPFSIYNLTLFSETGTYSEGFRPLMLTLKYHKPVDGRDFAISLARSWSNLGITLPEQDEVVDRLRKSMPNIKKGDSLSYIALPNKGYFVLNDRVIGEEFNADFNNAVVAVWLDQRVEIGRALLSKERHIVEKPKSGVVIPQTVETEVKEAEVVQTEGIPTENGTESTLQAVTSEQNFTNLSDEAKPEPTPETVVEKAPETPEKTEVEKVETPKLPAEKPAAEPQAEKKEDESLEILPLHDFIDITQQMG